MRRGLPRLTAPSRPLSIFLLSDGLRRRPSLALELAHCRFWNSPASTILGLTPRGDSAYTRTPCGCKGMSLSPERGPDSGLVQVPVLVAVSLATFKATAQEAAGPCALLGRVGEFQRPSQKRRGHQPLPGLIQVTGCSEPSTGQRPAPASCPQRRHIRLPTALPVPNFADQRGGSDRPTLRLAKRQAYLCPGAGGSPQRMAVSPQAGEQVTPTGSAGPWQPSPRLGLGLVSSTASRGQ